VPDWVLAALRFIWAPVTWGRRRLRKRYADRQALVREGSEIVTRVQQFAESLGPASIMLVPTTAPAVHMRSTKSSSASSLNSLTTA
jgi:hypothetical protein